MANPLMKPMLNNILVKAGRKTASTTIQTENQNHSINLRKEQVNLLLSDVLHGKKNSSYSSNNAYNSPKEAKMLTLEELRKPNAANTAQAYQVKSSVIEKPMVSLVSIGKQSKK